MQPLTYNAGHSHDDVNMQDASFDTTLGILAGGQATRLGGLDKAWLERDGVPQVLRIVARWRPSVAEVLVSANRDLHRYADAGLPAVPDIRQDLGPIGGLEALASACRTAWLLTVPVDLVDANDCLLSSLQAAGGQGAYAEDDDGPQPLVALWSVTALRAAIDQAMASNDHAVRALQRRLGMVQVRLSGVRFGNLNTPENLREVGIDSP